MADRELTEADWHSGGVVRGSTVTRTCRATGETVLVPLRKAVEEVSRITGISGKSAEDETAAACCTSSRSDPGWRRGIRPRGGELCGEHLARRVSAERHR